MSGCECEFVWFLFWEMLDFFLLEVLCSFLFGCILLGVGEEELEFKRNDFVCSFSSVGLVFFEDDDDDFWGLFLGWYWDGWVVDLGCGFFDNGNVFVVCICKCVGVGVGLFL